MTKRQIKKSVQRGVVPLLFGCVLLTVLIILGYDTFRSGSGGDEGDCDCCMKGCRSCIASGQTNDGSSTDAAASSMTNNCTHHSKWILEASHPCNIRRITLAQLQDEFPSNGLFPPLYPSPLIIVESGSGVVGTVDSERNAVLRMKTRRETLLHNFEPGFVVTLSSSNSFSERRRTIPLQQYMDEMEAQAGETETTTGTSSTTHHPFANESWYLFGETYTDAWQSLLDLYDLPPCASCVRSSRHNDDVDIGGVTLSFGLGTRGSGVSWHTHGPGFSETLHGRKHWVLYPSTTGSGDSGSYTIPTGFDKDESSRAWMENQYPNAHPKPLECTLRPGDLIYFPDRYWHATINLDAYTAFVSTFTSEHVDFDNNNIDKDNDDQSYFSLDEEEL